PAPTRPAPTKAAPFILYPESCIGAASGGAGLLLFGVGDGGVAHPLAVINGALALLNTLDAAGAVALEHVEKFLPLDFAEIVVAGFLVPFQVRVRGGAAEEFQLRHGLVKKALAQFVVAVAFDFPGHGLRGVR